MINVHKWTQTDLFIRERCAGNIFCFDGRDATWRRGELPSNQGEKICYAYMNYEEVHCEEVEELIMIELYSDVSELQRCHNYQFEDRL